MSISSSSPVGDNPETPFLLRHHVSTLLYCTVFAFGAFQFGYDNSYFTGVVGMKSFVDKYGNDHDSNGDISFSASLLSELTSLIQVGELVGSFLSGFVGFYFGCKGGLVSASVIATVVIILQAAAPNIAAFQAGRIVLGLGVGVLSGSVPIYLSDVTPRQIRGMVVGSWQLIMSIAGLIGSGICQGTEGYVGQAAYQIPVCFQLICPLVILVFIWFVPESPRRLISRNKSEEARAALCKINQSNKEYSPTIQLNEFIDHQQHQRDGSWWELITDPVERRKTLLAAGIFAAQQLTGNSFIISYSVVFAEDLEIANPFAINCITSVLSIVGVISSWFLVERFDRKTMLTATTCFMVCDMLVIGGLACGPQKSHLVPIAPLSKTIIGLALVYVFCFNLVWGPMAWTVATELGVGRNRPRIMAVSTAVFWFFSWLITFTLPYLFTTVQLGAKVGFIYAGSTFACTLLFVTLLLPETRGRTLEEIEEMFADRIPAFKWQGHHNIRTQAEAVTEEKVMVAKGVDNDGSEKAIYEVGSQGLV